MRSVGPVPLTSRSVPKERIDTKTNRLCVRCQRVNPRSGSRAAPAWPCHHCRGGLAKRGRRTPAPGILKSGLTIGTNPTQADASALCQSCGACCAFSREWPRFSTEADADLDLIPPTFVDETQGRMRCSGDRCSALIGDVGVATSCAVYAVRPAVCRTCLPGDDECRTARRRFGLAPVLGP